MYRSRIHFEKELVKVWGGGECPPPFVYLPYDF